MSIMDQRHAAVAETIGKVRAIEREHGVTPAALDRIKPALIALARRTELFPRAQFGVPEGQHGRIYRLAEDADHRFALYASAGVPGKAQPPHNHTTWAVIAGVYGREHNVFYDRIDNRQTLGEGRLAKRGELTVEKGNAVGFLPDDFHTIEVLGDEPSLHLHLYGLSLEHLPGRISFARNDGGPYKTFPANPNIAQLAIPPADLKTMIRDGEELAILDVREEGVFARSHLLLAASMPLSHLETRMDALVTRRSTRVVVVDEDGGALAHKAAYRLFDFGYKNIALLQGGVQGWKRAGYELFSGVFVPSKAFGEFVEHHQDTPRIEPAELKAKIDAGEKMVILDSRPMEEFTRMCIPGGIDCPGAELVYRVHDLAPSADTLVVVNCAGRTRSIIGAQSLINAGIPNKVVALKNGTMGWHLAGLELARGKTLHAPAPGPAGLAKAKEAAARVARRFGVKTIDHAGLARLASERDKRSLYLLDVRTPEEYGQGHLPGSRHAPGGQLVQSTDLYVGTRNSRLVLVDNDGVRATMTASWLIQMGWDEVYVLSNALVGQALETGEEKIGLLADPPSVTTMAPAELRAALDRGEATVIDLDTSLAYRAGHIPGAWFAIRARLADSVAKVPGDGPVVITSPDGVNARFAAGELSGLTKRKVLVLDGGTAAWRRMGYPLEQGDQRLADSPDDVWYKPYDNKKGVEQAMKDYLSWEVALVEQLRRDGDTNFRTVPPA
jgi:rhodanese-related sulfurtransferase/predicted metal-dependent enzyme (double-stranded beta helix superfamily)